tara:strand:- start:348 stop:1019 length:672 start_codon:yes stop_codon:yes gene_type:complete
MNIKILVTIIVLIVFLIIIFALNNSADIISFVNTNITNLKDFDLNNPILSGVYFFVIYILLTSFSLPVAFILGITSGIVFDPYKAILLVSFSSSIGATFALIISRYIFRDFLEKKYHDQYKVFNDGFVKNGIYYLFAIRMSPVFPYFLVNLFSGLTTMRILPYYLTTQIGMLPNTILVILLGNGLDKIILLDAKIETDFILILTIIGMVPLVLNYVTKKYLKK